MVTKTLNTLRRLLEKGIYLFPVTPDSREAWPGFSWPKVSTLQIEYIESWLMRHPDSNWGVDAGKSDLLILDVDCKSGKPGLASFDELDILHGVPPTFVVRTPSGGMHYYFKGVSRNRIGFRPGLDIRSARGYVVAPGSSIAGVPYEIIHDLDIANAPEWLVEMAGAHSESDPDRNVPICEIDHDRARENAVEYASLAEPAVEGLGGDTRTFVVACQLRDYGVDQEACLEIMLEHWNPRCEPPWEENELQRKVDHAYRYAKDRPGNESPEARIAEAVAMFGDAPPSELPKAGESHPPRPGVSTLRSFGEIGMQSLPREWILEDWIPAGPSAFTLFTGDGGTGKSMVAIAMGLAISLGEPWEGIRTTQQPVIYISCEDDEDEIDRRVYAHRTYPGREAMGCFDRPFYVQSRTGKNSLLCVSKDGHVMKGPFYAELDIILGRIPGPKVLILDTLVDMFGGNENARPEVNTFVKSVVGSLTVKHNATGILLAHPPKNTGATYSGSTAWNGAVRNRIFLKNHDPKRKTKYRVLSNEKANYGASGGEMVMKYDHGIYVAVDQVEMEGLLQSAILDAVQAAQDSGAPLSLTPQSSLYVGRATITDQEGVPVASENVIRIITDLLSRGAIKNVTGKSRGNGLYIS